MAGCDRQPIQTMVSGTGAWTAHRRMGDGMTQLARLAIPLLLAVSAAAPAQAAGVILPDSGDSGWLLGCTLVALMTALPGAYLLASGSWSTARAGAAVSIAAMAMGALIVFAIGYSLMFDLSDGPISAYIGGGGNWMLNLMGTVRDGTTVPETAFVLFQLAFVLLAVALLCGRLAAVAGRGWMLAFTGLWLLLVLAPVTRWLWGGGWLAEWGAIDASGGLTIFYCAGVSAIVARAIIGGPADPAERDPDARLTGAVLLLIGMAAFGGGATLGAGDDAAVAVLAVLAAAATGLLILAVLKRALDAGTIATGLAAGTIAISAAGDGVSIGGAMLIGAIAALAVAVTPAFVRRLIPSRLTRHDPQSDGFALTGAAKTGVMLAAIFTAFVPFGGSGYADGMTMSGQIIAQIVAILAVALWATVGTAIAALMAGLVLPMRAPAD